MSIPPAPTDRSALEATIDSASTWHVLVTVLVGLAAQLAILARKDVWIFEWRPTDLAAISLNYYRHGFHFLRPQVFWGGSGTGDVEMECPLIPYLISLLYALFGVHDWVAMTIPVLSGIGLAVVVNRFATSAFGPTIGLVAGLFTATSPALVAMSTGLWPDVLPMLCGTLGLYVLQGWVTRGGVARFVLAAAGVALAILLKLTSLYFGLPVAFLFWSKYGRAMWRRGPVWIFGALVLVPPALWYAHAYQLFLESRNTFGILASGYSKFGSMDLLTDPRFYVWTGARVAMFHTTPLGFVLVLIGIASPLGRGSTRLFLWWLAAVLIYFLVAAEGVSLGHYQYALPIVPPAAVLASIGCIDVVRRLEAFARSLQPTAARNVVAVALVLLAANVALANLIYERHGTASSRLSAEKMRTGLALARLSQPGDLIVVVDTRMDDVTPDRSMTPPEVFYFSDRRGWYRSAAWLTPDTIDDLRTQGARYLAVSANSVDWFREHYAALYRTYSTQYRTLLDNDDGIVYDLRDAP